MKQRDEDEAEACKALDEAAGDLSEWVGNPDLEELGIEWWWDEWPEIRDEMGPFFEQVEDKISEVQGDLKNSEDAADAIENAQASACDYPEIVKGLDLVLEDGIRNPKLASQSQNSRGLQECPRQGG
jgi:hypothetical protein